MYIYIHGENEVINMFTYALEHETAWLVAVGLYLCTFLTTPLGEEQSASRSDFFTP
jgi:hypothetical protein